MNKVMWKYNVLTDKGKRQVEKEFLKRGWVMFTETGAVLYKPEWKRTSTPSWDWEWMTYNYAGEYRKVKRSRK